MAVTINGKNIGNGYPSFIVLEAGPTHDSLGSAKRLVQAANMAGADAIKFQILDPDRLVADRQQLFSYEILSDRESGASETVTEPLYNILKRRCLTKDEWRELKAYCDSLDLVFFSTATFEDEVDFLVELGCDTVKVCSGDIDHLPFIEYCARTGMCVQIDTGNATIGEVERATDTILACGNDRIIIHHCPSGYPARLESINLNIITTLKKMFSFPIAFSDHTPGWDMDVAATALGANMVEKTITMDRTTPSVEHMFSLEPFEMQQFVKTVRDVEIALGGYRKIIQPEERDKNYAIRRSLVTCRAVVAGEKVCRDTVEFARPGFGLRPSM